MVTFHLTLDQSEVEFLRPQPIGRLGCPMDFINSIGNKIPIALRGRFSLYSL